MQDEVRPENALTALASGPTGLPLPPLVEALSAALVSYTPETFTRFSCTLREGTEGGRRALFYEIACPDFPDDGTTTVNAAVHEAATRLVRAMTPPGGTFPGARIQLARDADGRWRTTLAVG